MQQNPPTNKFSSFIGISLLISVIGFTVFINFFTEEPTEEIKEEIEIVEKTELELKFLDSADLSNLWKLKNLQVDSTKISEDGQRTYIYISKNLGSATNNPSESLDFEDLDAATKKSFQEAYDNFAQGEFIVNYGVLDFKNSYVNNVAKLEDVEIRHLDDVHSYKLMGIGILFLNYQIQSITTNPKYGNFTLINLKDGRKIFLIQQNAEVKDEHYKELIENAEYLNDSTRVILPY